MRQRQIKSQQLGLTLFETIVIMVIIGGLATLILPDFMVKKHQNDWEQAVSDIVMLQDAMNKYKHDNGRYPTTQQGLAALIKKPTIPPVPQKYRPNGYIRQLPKDPWGHNYLMLNPGKHGPIDIFSKGPDGRSGTVQDVGNWDINIPD
ncbi:MAG: type II secretion system major pseudopilin GspG [Endozoicomonas sp. (ex Botrylloides leachii)]|nr:type II secretion system major pseudopilin GspG [Endozoicomonas sp. (ex Botrylloides leachii)]